MMEISEETKQRFWTKVAITADIEKCWLWLASKNGDGYGGFRFNGKQDKAHRIAYLLYYKNYPEKLHCLHKCDNPSCVNPHHLFLGTNHDNILDSVAKGRHVVPKGDTHYLRAHPERRLCGEKHWSRKHLDKITKGEKHGMSKITEKDVLEIRKLYSEGGISQRKLAKMYGLTQYPIAAIIKRKSWKHI